MKSSKKDQLSQDAEVLISCVTGILNNKKIKYELAEVDLSHAESIWYKITIVTLPTSRLKLVLNLFQDAVGIFCNDFEIFIYPSEQLSDFRKWMEHLPSIISAIMQPQIRIRGRRSWLSGKKAAIWLELPEGGKWMGDKKACKGSGKEYIFRNWLRKSI